LVGAFAKHLLLILQTIKYLLAAWVVWLGSLLVAEMLIASPKVEEDSLMIFMDKPYKPGQRIVVEGHDGFVEQIGLRSTKIRMLTGAQTSIPNERMARLDIENIGRRSFIRRQSSIRLSYDTPAAMECFAEADIKLALPAIKNYLSREDGQSVKDLG